MDELHVVRNHIALVLNHIQGGVTASYVRHDNRQHKLAALQAWADELMAILNGQGKTDRQAAVIPLAKRPRGRPRLSGKAIPA
jgi:hypothetical protein